MASRTRNPVKVTRLDGSVEYVGVGPLSTSVKLSIYQRDGFKCRYCGHQGSSSHFEIDHSIPRSKGGTDSRSNLVVACWVCNHYKLKATWTVGQKPWDRHDFDRKRYEAVKRRRKRAMRKAREAQAPLVANPVVKIQPTIQWVDVLFPHIGDQGE